MVELEFESFKAPKKRCLPFLTGDNGLFEKWQIAKFVTFLRKMKIGETIATNETSLGCQSLFLSSCLK